MNLKSGKNVEELKDVDINIKNVYVDKAYNEIAYLYTIPSLGNGLCMTRVNDSILKNPENVVSKILEDNRASIHYKYNLPYERK